ncbi:MAG: adenine deaminase [Spirochaetaceae bacterium]|jgi:adenine deaminase|nr:adenine deaminase [Spirochaetaceae bacterium]
MTKANLKKLIDVASGRIQADLVLKGGTIADVYSGNFVTGDLALCDDRIAGIGSYKGAHEIDVRGLFVLPGFIDSHMHIESTHLCPEELGRLLVPMGTTMIVSDPHEIVNIAGLTGLEYMFKAAEKTALGIAYMLPSCVPTTPFEQSGAVLEAAAMTEPLNCDRVLGLGELMNFPAVVQAESHVLDKILAAYHAGKLIDGHCPGLNGLALNAYTAARVHDDHECETPEEVYDRLARGMYVMLRQGSACRNLRALLPCVTKENERRFVFCSDDRQPQTIIDEGHVDGYLRMAVDAGLSPMTAIRMATLNAAECFRLHDQGGIAPGLRADLALVDNLHDFRVQKVFIGGALVAEDGVYHASTARHDDSTVRGSFHVKDFSQEKLRLPLSSDTVYVIDMKADTVLTGKGTARVKRSSAGEFIFDAKIPVVKIAVIERHCGTGNVALGLIRGYGLNAGAIAISIAHDSHNIITVGASDADMEAAVQCLLAQGGGVVLVKDRAELVSMPLPLAGILSDRDALWVKERLDSIKRCACTELGVNPAIDPVMTLCFMSLAVIPELKITDHGLFDVGAYQFIPLEVPSGPAL